MFLLLRWMCWMPLLLKSITVTNMRCIPISMQRLRCFGRIRVQILIIFLGLSVFLMTTSVGLDMQWLSVIRQSPSATPMAPIPISAIRLVNGQLIVPKAWIGIYTQTKIRFTNKKKELEQFPTPCFLWTSLGLNQGPPDYESLPYSLIDVSLSACYRSLKWLEVNYRSTFPLFMVQI